ncbi:MAG: DMT family transporter [Anaerolineales bacterium]|nr:DMT family transporter [Anaerolineales bacterium]
MTTGGGMPAADGGTRLADGGLSPADRLNAPLLVVALLAVDGLHFVFARALHGRLPPVTAVAFVLGIATLQIAGFAAVRGQLRPGTFWKHRWFFLAVGGLVALSTTLNYAAVGFVDPGAASLLSQTSILFGLALGVLWLRDRLSRRQWAGAALTLFGAGLISFQPGDYFRLGSLLVIGSALLYAVHAALVKRHGGEMAFLEFFVWRLAATTGFLLLAVTAQGAWQWPDATTWLLLFVAGTVDVVISRALYYLALRRLTITLHSLVLTFSPVVAILWSLALFGIWPGAQALLGGLAVVTGIAVVTMRRG